eukprot:TRINITY_DN1532_c0_g1_i1.p1 TRINITY_DN1532_c0_g1~~TRINITY_DN1532_c0_g1_i1.p1  ORF type:complete len:246 (+),score=41.77 TRINITY_DN1532_c0_g1_i1:76-738(+)
MAAQANWYGKGNGYGGDASWTAWTSKAPTQPKGAGRSQPYSVVPPPSNGKAAGKPAATGGKNDMRPGDWYCALCGNHNYADKIMCNKCAAPKAITLNMMQYAQYAKGKGDYGKMREGDWKCHACSNINYASRTECNKCGVPKTAYISKSGMRAGDWICAACNNHNFADKMMCNKCGAGREGAKEHTAKMRPGDWLCPACKNHNYADKAACNKCGYPKPVV